MIRKYSIPLFIIFTYALSFVGGQLFYNPNISDYFPQPLLLILRILFLPAIVAPFSVAILLSYVENKKYGVRNLLKKFCHKRIPIQWYILAIIIPFVVHFFASILDSWRGTNFLPPFGNVSERTIVSMIIIFILAGVGEEMGWRGYLLPRLQKKYSSVISSIIVGLVTGFWHLPLFLIRGAFHSNHAFIPFLLLSIAFSFIYTWLMDNTHAVLILALFHTFHDIASMNFSQRDHLSSFLVYAVIAVIIVIVYGMKRFKKSSKIKKAEQ